MTADMYEQICTIGKNIFANYEDKAEVCDVLKFFFKLVNFLGCLYTFVAKIQNLGMGHMGYFLQRGK